MSEQTQKTETKISILSGSTIEVPAEGGDYDVYYALVGEADNVVATANIPTMFNVINTNTRGKLLVGVSANDSSSARVGKITLTYGTSAVDVTFNQAGVYTPESNLEVVNVAANQLAGDYYGDRFGEGKGHYYVILSKDGFVGNNVVAGGEFFCFDLVAPVTDATENIKLPDGDYTFDTSLNYNPYTIISIGNTEYVWYDEKLEACGYDFANATLSVRGNHLEFVGATQDKEYHVTFDGEYSISKSELTDYISSLKKDTVIDVSNCYAAVKCFGDYWECGYTNWQVEFVCNDTMKYGTYVVIDFFNNSTTDFTGTYVASGFTVEDPTKPDFRPGTFVPGFRVSDYENQMMGSLFMVYKDGKCISQAPLYGGTVTITANADGTYTIVIDALDDAPTQNKITLNWTGTLQ